MRNFMNMISESMNGDPTEERKTVENLTTEDAKTVIRYIDCDGPIKIGFGVFAREWLPSYIAHRMLGHESWQVFILTNLRAAKEFEASRQAESYEIGQAAAWVPPHLA